MYLEKYLMKRNIFPHIQVADLARINHENAGKLLGYCSESTPFTRMLVFEYASNGTLSEHLHCKLIIFCSILSTLSFMILLILKKLRP